MHEYIPYNKKEAVKKRILEQLNGGDWINRNRKYMKSENSDTLISKRLFPETYLLNDKTESIHLPLNITWDSALVSSFLYKNMTSITSFGSYNSTLLFDKHFDPSCTMEYQNMSETMNAEEPSSILAYLHYERLLKVRAFKSIKVYALSRKTKRDLRITADLCYTNHIRTCYFNKWMRNLKINDVLNHLKWVDACDHHRRQLLERHFRHWKSLIGEADNSDSMALTADQFRRTHCDKILLTDTFSTWLILFRKTRVADSMYRKNLLGHVIQHWHHCAVRRGEKRYMQRVARLHFIEQARRYWLTAWHQSWIETRQVHVLAEQAVHFRQMRLLKLCFQSWWQEYHERFIRMEYCVKQIETGANRSRLRTAWSHWRAYAQRCHRDKTIVTHVKQLHSNTLIQTCFHAWITWIRLLKQRRDCTVRNHQIHMQTKQLKKSFDSWLSWAIQHKEERIQIDIATSTMCKKSEMLLKGCTLKRWRLTLELQEKINLAKQHASTRLVRNCFQNWRKMCDLRREKLRTQLAANRFRSVTLRAEAIRIWHQSYRESIRLRQLDSLALCRWALCLQARAWSAWREWLSRRKTKQARRAAALDRYWEHRAQVAIGAMIEAATMKRHERQEICFHRYWNSNRRTFQLALNAATRWRFWTARRLEQRNKSHTEIESEAPIPPSPCHGNLPVSPVLMSPLARPSHDEDGSKPIGMVAQSRGAFDMKPLYPDFLISDLQTQGLIESEVLTGSKPNEPLTALPMADTKQSIVSVPGHVPREKTKNAQLQEILNDTNELLEMIQLYRIQHQRLRLWRFQRRLNVINNNSSTESPHLDDSLNKYLGNKIHLEDLTEQSYRKLHATVRHARKLCRERLRTLMETTSKLTNA